MKYFAIALSALSLLFVTGCSDQNNSKPVATSSVAATSPVKTIFLVKDLPADIKGFPSEVAGRCAVDIVNDPVKDEVIAINRAAGLNIYGWALDEKITSVPPVVFLHLLKGTESYYGQLNRRGDRGDLAKAFGKPEFINEGYGGTVDISSLPVGRYEILVIQKGENKSLVCSTNHKLELRD
jgi:hypothetical protein